MLVASSCSALIASDMPYILPEHPLRVSKKPKSHLEKVNEDVLVGITSGDECGQWAGRVKGPASSVACFAISLLRTIRTRVVVRDRAC